MEEKKQEETTPVSTDAVPNEETVSDTITETETAPSAVETTSSPIENETQTQNEIGGEVENKTPFKGMSYIIAIIVVVVIGLGLLFVLERDGRVATGIFSGITENMNANLPSAKVNGVVIPKSDFDSGVLQLMEVAKSQGADVTDPQIVSQFNSQAIDTLVNGELLRQAAQAEGITVSGEEVDARFNEISEGVGGIDVLKERMAEFNIDEESLRRDIENEVLIQGLFDIILVENDSEVTEEEVLSFYDQAGGEEAGLPPLEDVRDQIEEQILLSREQEQVGNYIDGLREDADIEILI